MNVSGLSIVMNIPPILLRKASFLELREKIGLGAMHVLVALGTILQSDREAKIKITSKKQLLLNCDVAGEIDQDVLWDALVGSWLIPLGDDEYAMPFFSIANKQLMNNWENGRRSTLKATETKQKKEKENKRNGTQSNSDAFRTASGAHKQCLGDVGGSASMDQEDLKAYGFIPSAIPVEPVQPSPHSDIF